MTSKKKGHRKPEETPTFRGSSGSSKPRGILHHLPQVLKCLPMSGHSLGVSVTLTLTSSDTDGSTFTDKSMGPTEAALQAAVTQLASRSALVPGGTPSHFLQAVLLGFAEN